MTVDLAMGGQQASLGNSPRLLGITLIFAADLHHLAIAGIRGSYSMLPPVGVPSTGDAATLAIRAAGQFHPGGSDRAVHRLCDPVQSRIGRPVAADAATAGLPRHAGHDPHRDAALLATVGVMMSVFVEDLAVFLKSFVRA